MCFPALGWDFKQRVAFRCLWFNAAICHTWLNSWNFLCMHAHVSVYSLSACAVLNLCIRVQHTAVPLLILLIFCRQGHLPFSCQEVQSMSGPLPDSEHFLSIQGKALKVWFYDYYTANTESTVSKALESFSCEGGGTRRAFPSHISGDTDRTFCCSDCVTVYEPPFSCKMLQMWSVAYVQSYFWCCGWSSVEIKYIS